MPELEVPLTKREVEERLETALTQFRALDTYLLSNNLNERCIAGRLAFHLQNAFRDFVVDIEYNRCGGDPKRIGLTEACANRRSLDGRRLVIPDIVVHKRGSEGPNILVLEMKKSSNAIGTTCDEQRLLAYRAELRYQHSALILCKTDEPPYTIEFSWVEPPGALGSRS